MHYVLLIDADYMVYSAGFATEDVEYEVSATLATGEVVEDVVDTLDAAKAWREGRDWPLGTRHREPQRLVTPEPFGHARFILRNIYKKILDRAGAHFGEEFDTFVYLTGSSNFRNDIATIKPYKGNRKALHKPIHYKALREFIASELEGRVVEEIEADDAVAMHAAAYNYDNRVLIAAVDKDLWTVPGWHYNFMRDEFSDVSPEAALLNFYMQLLTGDPVDNIGGCWKCGAKSAREILSGIRDEETLYAAVLREYEASLTRPGCPYDNAKTALLENARLLHMMRHPGDVWVPPGHALRDRVAAAMKDASWQTWMKGGFSTNTSPGHFPLPPLSLDSSAPTAEQPSPDAPATPQTSSSAKGRKRSTSKRKGSSRRTTRGASSRSTKSTSKGSPE